MGKLASQNCTQPDNYLARDLMALAPNDAPDVSGIARAVGPYMKKGDAQVVFGRGLPAVGEGHARNFLRSISGMLPLG